MSDLRDELAIALGCRARKVITDPQRLTALFEWALAEAVLPITERRLAAERAATIDECHVAILEALDRRRPHDAAWLEPMRIVKETALALPRDHSALEAMLARARAEQRDKDAKEIPGAIEFAVEWTIKQLSRKEEWPLSWAAGFPSFKAEALFAYVIRAQEDCHAEARTKMGGDGREGR